MLKYVLSPEEKRLSAYRPEFVLVLPVRLRSKRSEIVDFGKAYVCMRCEGELTPSTVINTAKRKRDERIQVQNFDDGLRAKMPIALSYMCHQSFVPPSTALQ